ncbi:MAG: hypothetical protein R3C03_07610 [Pirellulaceae bacterium]
MNSQSKILVLLLIALVANGCSSVAPNEDQSDAMREKMQQRLDGISDKAKEIYFLVQLSESKENDAESLAGFQVYVEKYPSAVHGWEFLGLEYLKGDGHLIEKNSTEAEKCFLKAIELNTAEAWVYNLLGDIYLQRDDLENARQYFLTAVFFDVEKIDSNINLMRVETRARNISAAVEYGEKAWENIDQSVTPSTSYLELPARMATSYAILRNESKTKQFLAVAEKWNCQTLEYLPYVFLCENAAKRHEHAQTVHWGEKAWNFRNEFENDGLFVGFVKSMIVANAELGQLDRAKYFCAEGESRNIEGIDVIMMKYSINR